MASLRRAIVFTLSFQLALLPVHAETSNSAAAPARVAQPAKKIDLNTDEGLAQIPQIKELLEADPYFEDLFKSPELKDASMEFSPTDPALDQYPFFVHPSQQSWVESSAVVSKAGSEIAWSKPEAKKLLLNLPGSNKSLQLNIGLTPFLLTNEKIFLSADDESMFLKASGLLEHNQVASGGIFFIARKEMFDAYQTHQPVPIYFLPLVDVDTGWDGNIKGVELYGSDQISVTNEIGQSVFLRNENINYLMKIQRMNYFMACMMALRANQLDGDQSDQVTTPQPGVTAGFGMLFTGLDLKNPERSFWKNPAAVSEGFSKENLFKIKTWLMPFLPKQAHAAIDHSLVLPAILNKLVYISNIFAGLGVYAFIMMQVPSIKKKLEIMRQKLDEQKKLQPPTTRFGKFLRENKNALWALGHSNTHAIGSLVQFVGITTGNLVNLYLDRAVPQESAAENTIVRKVMNKSWLFSKNRVSNNAISLNTFINGAIIHGAIDTGFVYVQYIWTIPWLMRSAEGFVDDGTKSLIQKTFSSANESTMKQISADVARNAVAHLIGGASGFASGLKTQFTEEMMKVVDAEYLAKGINPLSHDIAGERKKLIDERVNTKMKQQGLPDKDQFLYDSNFIFQKIGQAMGYSVPEALKEKSSFFLEERFNLTKHVLDRAIKILELQQTDGLGLVSEEALKILKSTKGKMGFLLNSAKNGIAGFKEARKVRQLLTLLSYDGPTELLVKYVPEVWTSEFSGDGARAAVMAFRLSLHSFISGRGLDVYGPTREQMQPYFAQAEQRAIEYLSLEYKDMLEYFPIEERENVIRKSFKNDFEAARRSAVVKLMEEKSDAEAAAKFKPDLGWFEQRQANQAAEYAQREMEVTQFFRSDMRDPNSETYQQAWVQLYTDNLAKQVGLQTTFKGTPGRDELEYAKVLKFAKELAQINTDLALKGNPSNVSYLKRASAKEALDFKAWIYSGNFLRAFSQATTELGQMRSLSPYQPGKTQYLRQLPLFKEHRWLGNVAGIGFRAVDALYDDQASLNPGFKAWMSRNLFFPLPFCTDVWTATQRSLKAMPLALTVGYAWTYYFWNIHIDYGMYTMFALLGGATISAPQQVLVRWMRMIGIPTMKNPLTKILYSVPYAWVTFGGMIPVLLYGPMFSGLIDSVIVNPAKGFYSLFESWQLWSAFIMAATLSSKKIRDKINSFTGMQTFEQKAVQRLAEDGSTFVCENLFVTTH